MAHYSLANTTLIGQEVQQRLWEKFWGHQCPAVPMPLMWYQQGMCYHEYLYGVPTTFHTASMHHGFDQSRNLKLLQSGNTVKNSNGGGDQTLKFHHGKDVLAELLNGQNITKISNQTQCIITSSPKVSAFKNSPYYLLHSFQLYTEEIWLCIRKKIHNMI